MPSKLPIQYHYVIAMVELTGRKTGDIWDSNLYLISKSLLALHQGIRFMDLEKEIIYLKMAVQLQRDLIQNVGHHNFSNLEHRVKNVKEDFLKKYKDHPEYKAIIESFDYYH